MGATTEQDIFDVLATNFREAAERCEVLAWHPQRGRIYEAFRNNLRLIEGACIQAANWREDTRWLGLSLVIGEAHKRAGNWLRGYIAEDSRKAAHPMFLKLAEKLREGQAHAETLKTAKTGKRGLILPRPVNDNRRHRDTRPVQVVTPGGIILPSAA